MAIEQSVVNIGAAMMGGGRGGMRGPGVRYDPSFRPNRVYDEAAVAKSFEALATFDFGSDYQLLLALDDGVIAAHGTPEEKSLETRLIAVLKADPAPSRGAKDFVCRMLRKIGTAESVPALAELLLTEEGACPARLALQRMPAPEAIQALRDALPKVDGALRLGVIQSLAACRDAESVPAMKALAADADADTSRAAIVALGRIGNPDAAKVLAEMVKTAADEKKAMVGDAYLACAEQALADGNRAEALAIYRTLAGADQPSQIRVAASTGMLAAASQRD